MRISIEVAEVDPGVLFEVVGQPRGDVGLLGPRQEWGHQLEGQIALEIEHRKGPADHDPPDGAQYPDSRKLFSRIFHLVKGEGIGQCHGGGIGQGVQQESRVEELESGGP